MRAHCPLLGSLLLLASCAPSPTTTPECHHHSAPHPTPATAAARAPRAEPKVIFHSDLRSFENSGNTLTGLATPSLGATSAEVWRSSIAPHSRTPEHTHQSEEIFVVLGGRGILHVGEQALPFEAPATVIAPAGVPHWVENTGDAPTDQLVVVAAGSTIVNARREVMDLPWRR